jgi:hypothetical protein
VLGTVTQRLGFSLPAVFIASSQGSLSVPKPTKQNVVKFGDHGSIRDSRPIAFSGCPRGPRVGCETRCPKHAAPTRQHPPPKVMIARTHENSRRRAPHRSSRSTDGRRLLVHEQFYFSISENQFRSMDSGAAAASSNFVEIRNLCPSSLTS